MNMNDGRCYLEYNNDIGLNESSDVPITVEINLLLLLIAFEITLL